MNLKPEKTALIIVDVQEALDAPDLGKTNYPAAEQNVSKLLAHWRKEKLPLFLIQYFSPRLESPFYREAPGSGLRETVRPLPGETLIIKHFESAFMKTELEERLKEAKVEALIFTGFYTDQCVAASAKTANNLGFRVFVVSDATGSTGCRGYLGKYYDAEDVQQLALGGMQRDGISIVESSDLLHFF